MNSDFVTLHLNNARCFHCCIRGRISNIEKVGESCSRHIADGHQDRKLYSTTADGIFEWKMCKSSCTVAAKATDRELHKQRGEGRCVCVCLCGWR